MNRADDQPQSSFDPAAELLPAPATGPVVLQADWLDRVSGGDGGGSCPKGGWAAVADAVADTQA